MDRPMEGRASELFHHHKYAEAAEVYTQCLEVAKEHADRVNILLNRASCHLKQRKFEEACSDCDEVLSSDQKNEKALWKKVKVLCFQGQFSEAHALTIQWVKDDPESLLASNELKRLNIIIPLLNSKEQDDVDEICEVRRTPEGREAIPQMSPTSKITSGTRPDNVSPTSKTTSVSRPDNIPDGQCDRDSSDHNEEDVNCSTDSSSSQVQINLDKHDTKSTTEGLTHDSPPCPVWRHRSPPRGLTSQEYSMCIRFDEWGRCTLGERCPQAHSQQELTEWKHRFDHQLYNYHTAKDTGEEKHRSGREILQEKILTADNVETLITEDLDFAKTQCNGSLKVSLSSKKSSNSWVFTVSTKVPLQRVILLDDVYKDYFHISSVSRGPKKSQKIQNLDCDCQEWINSDQENDSGKTVYRVTVVFQADLYGIFYQKIVFDYGAFPVVGRDIQVDLAPPDESNQFTEKLLQNSGSRWHLSSVYLVEFEPKPIKRTVVEEELLNKYRCPHPEKFHLSRALFENLSAQNYRQRMHDLLFCEEMEQFDNISRYNVKANLHLVDKFGLIGQHKSASNGELYARINIQNDLTEDSIHGRLILQNCQTAWIKEASSKSNTVFEALIDEKGKNCIFFRLSAECVKQLSLKPDTHFHAQVQFQLNRIPMCEMHFGVDKLPTVYMVFPDLKKIPDIPWSPERQWNGHDFKLNSKQKEAVLAITSPLSVKLPPLLLCGPYGTGKTYTLANAAKEVLKDPTSRILICTHSNSAADLYVKDFFHEYVTSGHPEATPLRIYYQYRRQNSVPAVVSRYCLRANENRGVSFHLPTRVDLDEHRIIITTMSMSCCLLDSQLDLPQGYFTHIFLDEAAQVLECSSLVALSLAGDLTRIVLAGDYMQLSPLVCSYFVKEKLVHCSLLERLYDYYPTDFPSKILLCENYRSHKAIVQLTSDLFYDSKLVASGKQSAHPDIYPLVFCTAKGEEIQHFNTTGFYNRPEIYEVVDRVQELKKTWPLVWGDFNESSIGIITPYSDQVIRIRAELKKRRMFQVSVERVLNVQGKQFRAVFLSVVRTHNSCSSELSKSDTIDYGFLSSVKLVNTAITRAQSLVVVVGDPSALCSLGKCRKVWEHFIRECDKNKSLYGTSWESLKKELDALEIKRTFKLNPLAPEFIPARLRTNVNGSSVPMRNRFTPTVPVMVPHPMMFPPYFGGYEMPNWRAGSPSSQRRARGGLPIPPNYPLPYMVPMSYPGFVNYVPIMAGYDMMPGYCPVPPRMMYPGGPLPDHLTPRPRTSPGGHSLSASPTQSAISQDSISPAPSPNSLQQIQLLPNVKHAPAHLMCQETPETRPTPTGQHYQRNSGYKMSLSVTNSRGRASRKTFCKSPQLTGNKHNTNHSNNAAVTKPMGEVPPEEWPALPGQPGVKETTSAPVQQSPPHVPRESSENNPSPFSVPQTVGSHTSERQANLTKGLRLNIKLANNTEMKETSNVVLEKQSKVERKLPCALPLPEKTDKATYAGVLKTPPSAIIPQTPVTPCVFPTTPRGDMGNHVMDILRNLDIKATSGELYQYFSQ